MNIIQKLTQNFWKGRNGQKPEAIVVHVMDGNLVGTDSWFANPASEASSHYGLNQFGEVHQYVQEEDTAWHAGVVLNPQWSLLKMGINPNYYTIGIEHEGNATSVWSAVMKSASVELIREISRRWNIPIDREHIIGHYQISSKKPNCPAANRAIVDELIALAKPPTSTPLRLKSRSQLFSTMLTTANVTLQAIATGLIALGATTIASDLVAGAIEIVLGVIVYILYEKLPASR